MRVSWIVLLLLWVAPVQAERPTKVGIHFQVAIEGGMNEANMTWLREHVRRANQLLAASGIALKPNFSKLQGGKQRDLRSRADRHALGKHLTDKPVIHVFVVQSLKDVDIKNKWISGVHWRPRGLPNKHFIILSRKAKPWTLTHELGHFFGNKHSDAVNNIMCYEHDGAREPFFDEAQRQQIARHLDRFLRTGELANVSTH